MKLYYAPGACSQAPHIALREAGLPVELVKVEFPSKRLPSGEDYYAINPKGAVPALQLDDGSVLTENAVLLQYVADRAPKADLIPPFGTMARYHLLEWLNYIATELHKGFGPLWNPATPEEFKQATRELVGKKFDYVQERLGDGPYLTGGRFTIADAYIFVILGWTGMHQIDLARWPGLTAFRARVAERPAVRAALDAEGLVQPA
jgi:glutathione S-transferase